MLKVSLPDPQYALKTAWRFVALVFCMSLLLVLAAVTTPWWVRVHEMAWFIFAVLFGMSLIVLVCFAFAGVGWALCAWLPRSSFRGAALRAFLAALISLFIIGGYALVFTGVIRLR
jgi:hypothetical protein